MNDVYQYAIKTPLISYLNSSIYLKLENLQPFGSYKIRGIANILQKEDPLRLKEGLVAASAGNMGQAVAYLAKQNKLACTIIVPDTAPQIKIEKIRSLGAKIIIRPFGEVWECVINEKINGISGYFIHPARNLLLREGYASMADELLEQCPSIKNVIIPFGVGGLTLGLAKRLKTLLPQINIFSIEPESASPFYHLQHKIETPFHRIPSFVDAIGTGEVLPDIYNQLSELGVQSKIISLEKIKASIKSLFFDHKIVAEGAAAAPLACALDGKMQDTVVIVSGGNIDFHTLITLFN